MSENPDRPVGGPTDAGTDVTPALNPLVFDFPAFVAGVRPTRRAVRIFPRGDLLGVMDRVVDAIEQAGDGPVDALIDEFEAARAEYVAASQVVTVEARSSEWVQRFRAEAAKTHGSDIDWTAEPTDEASRALRHGILVDQLAAQIVAPVGVTATDLAVLIEAAEGEAGKLFAALALANSQVSSAAKVLTLDFSQRRSGHLPPKRSRAR